MELRRTVDEDGLYLGHFEKLEEAEEWVDEQVRRYVFTPNPKDMSIRRICREANEEGIELHPNTFGKELKRRGVEIRNSRPRPTTTVNRTFSIGKETSEALDNYPNGTMSFVVDLGVRIATGVPTEHVVMFLPEEDGQTTLIFRKRQEKRIELYISGEVDVKFETQLRKLLKRAEEQSMEAVTRYAEQNGYTYFGGTRLTIQ